MSERCLVAKGSLRHTNRTDEMRTKTFLGGMHRVAMVALDKKLFRIGWLICVVYLAFNQAKNLLALQDVIQIYSNPQVSGISRGLEDLSFAEGLRKTYGLAPSFLSGSWNVMLAELLAGWILLGSAPFMSEYTTILEASVFGVILLLLLQLVHSHPALSPDLYNPYLVHTNALATFSAGLGLIIASWCWKRNARAAPEPPTPTTEKTEFL